ncbi:hypothetical protein KC342_g104 [Hortaea werneckii]|nr:hypothetical protein KC342_g104 [Hortaea werneckii]
MSRATEAVAMCLAMPCVNVSCCALKANIWLDCANQSNTLTSSAARLLHPSAIARLLAHSCSLKVVWEAIEHRSAVVDAARVETDDVKVLCFSWLSSNSGPAETVFLSEPALKQKRLLGVQPHQKFLANPSELEGGRIESFPSIGAIVGVYSVVSGILSTGKVDKMERPTRSHSKKLGRLFILYRLAFRSHPFDKFVVKPDKLRAPIFGKSRLHILTQLPFATERSTLQQHINQNTFSYLTHSFPLFSAVLTCFFFILLVACDKPPCEGRALRVAPA